MIDNLLTNKKIKDLEHGDVFILKHTTISKDKPLLAISPSDEALRGQEKGYSPDRINGLELHCLDNVNCTLSTHNLHPEMYVAVVNQKKDLEE